MRSHATQIVLAVLMAIAAFAGWALRPHEMLADQRPKVNLEQLLPKAFGNWKEVQQTNAQIVNPQQLGLLKKLYSQTLARTYIDNSGAAVMLSIAYGVNQSDGVALHYPEVCYPSQGFQLLSITRGTLDTKFGSIPVKRLLTKLGNRSEPVTYWTTISDKVVYSGMQTKFEQMKYGFKGQIPDGLIFRISSINQSTEEGYDTQSGFARDLASALEISSRLRFFGM